MSTAAFTSSGVWDDNDSHHLEDLLDEANRPHDDSPQQPLHAPAPEQRLPPVVLVEGFFSFFNEFFWGPIETHLNASRTRRGLHERRRILFARCGPVSSMHDRACELFYTIKGGKVDYGEEHSRQHGHSRWGRTFTTGQYPSWSAEHPVHFIAHSLGGTTVTVLQMLIRDGHFGPDAHPDMIASVNTVAAPFRGTSFAYLLGKSYQNSIDTRFFSIDSFITKNVHMLSWLKPVIPKWAPLPDWFSDARGLTMNESSVVGLVKQLWRSDWGEGRDVISFDSTFEGARQLDAKWLEKVPSPNTYYRSYVMCMTKRERPHTSYHVPSYKSPLVESLPMYAFATFVGKFDYRTVRPLPHFFKPGKQQPRPNLAPHVLQSRARSNSMRRYAYNNNNNNNNSYNDHYAHHNSTTAHHNNDNSSSSSSSSCDADSETSDSPSSSDPSPSTSTLPYTTSRGPTGIRADMDLGEDYFANDGVVPIFSQWHPGPCSPDKCVHHSTLGDAEEGGVRGQREGESFYFGLPAGARVRPEAFARTLVGDDDDLEFPSLSEDEYDEEERTREKERRETLRTRMEMNGVKPGVWNVCQVPDSTHVSLMPMWLGTQRQKEFWVEIGEWFEVVDNVRRVRRWKEMRKGSGVRTSVSSSMSMGMTGSGVGAGVGRGREERAMGFERKVRIVVDGERGESPMSLSGSGSGSLSASGSGSGTLVDDGADSPSDSEYESMKPRAGPMSFKLRA